MDIAVNDIDFILTNTTWMFDAFPVWSFAEVAPWILAYGNWSDVGQWYDFERWNDG